MRPLLSIFGLIWRAERWAMLRGIALSIVVLVMGVALLGLSGWFIIAAGAAGLAGMGATFDVFRPSAAVRFLALGRTGARYGERLLTHDATLRALAALRVRLLRQISAAPFAVMSRFRGAQVLNRLTADVDALDGVALRLVIPVLAGGATLATAWAVLAWLVDPRVAAWSVLSLLCGSVAALAWAARRGGVPSRLAEAASQAFRVRFIDHLRGRAMLAFAGQFDRSRDAVLAADARSRAEVLKNAQVERRAGALISISATLAAAGALFIGAELARAGVLSPALTALGFFATLALAETVAPLRRGVAEMGAMRDAARRAIRSLDTVPAQPSGDAGGRTGNGDLVFDTVALAAPGAAQPLLEGLSLRVAPGEVVALTGRSGIGKSSLLNAAAGLAPTHAGRIILDGRPVEGWPESELRGWLGYLPQRCALVSGTIAANLRLAAPDADDAALMLALKQVSLGQVVERLGGLEARLGEGGKGLSGGETRRLALARVLLRAPRVLLLDEPTEGLDHETALRVLDGIRAACPRFAILVAAHRPAERAWADRVVSLD